MKKQFVKSLKTWQIDPINEKLEVNKTTRIDTVTTHDNSGCVEDCFDL